MKTIYTIIMFAFALNASAQVNPKIERMADSLEGIGSPMAVCYSHWDNLTVSYSKFYTCSRYLNPEKVKPAKGDTIRDIIINTIDELYEDATEYYRKESHYDTDTLNCYMTLGKSNTEKVNFYVSSVFPVNDNALVKCNEQLYGNTTHPSLGEIKYYSGNFDYTVILDTINKPSEIFKVNEYLALIKPVLKGYKKAKLFFHHKATDEPVSREKAMKTGEKYVYSKVSHTNGTPTYDTETRGYVYFIPKEKISDFKKRMNDITESFLRSNPKMEFCSYYPSWNGNSYIVSPLDKLPNEIVEYIYPKVPKDFDIFYENTENGLFVAVTETSGDRWLEYKWYEDYYDKLGIKNK